MGSSWVASLEALRANLPIIVAQSCQEAAEESQQTIESKIKKNAENDVYSYSASSMAQSKRRYDMMNLHPEVSATDDSIVFNFKPKLPLQHSTSNRSGKSWGINAVRVVEEGMANYNQPYERPFLLDEDEESEIIGEAWSRAFEARISRYF